MAVLCLLFAFLVWDWTEKQINLYLSQINTGLERVAQVQTKSNNVIRNHNGQLLWQDIDAGEIVYLGNSIQTEKDSSTEIIFDDGEKVLVGPESLVRFNRADDQISLQLVEGKIEVQSPDVELQQSMRLEETKPKRLFIKTPKGKLNINNASLKIKADKNNENDFKVEVIKGEPELIATDKKEVIPLSQLVSKFESEKIEVLKAEEPKPQEIVEKLNDPADSAIEENTAQQLAQEPPVADELSSEYTEVSPLSTQTILDEVKTAEISQEVTPEVIREPAAAPLTAPKVKSIKVKEVE